ncbi:MAG: methylated-DNA--[protein]-cysteine S-methyltransferase [Phycisphaerales bacterium]|nr:methylated-DNA--[protein]-cysteine S-methyltransferase [Phycisphaerales bacterium]
MNFSIAGAQLKFEAVDGRVRADWIVSPAVAGRRGRGLPDSQAREIAALVAKWRRGRDPEPRRVAGLLPQTPEFFVACWKACMKIPRGETRTYSWLARTAGRPRAARAAAQSMARNPLPLLVPCHRVVGTGNPGGFCGHGHMPSMGGATREASRFLLLKAELLRIEAAKSRAR